ncbi:glycosyltransferase family 4 protein [Halodurantibacterium flavum]|uniref:Glycosyltransferase family 4 protein n=1 Tax=Halodurantibacterium flavum TaxID=1382802 RepID=A0ABW4RZF3_9RHOB
MIRDRLLVVVVKGYPRLSETFIAQELLGLERAGLRLRIVSLRNPTDTKRHPIHEETAAPVDYLPEYLYLQPIRVLRGLMAGIRRRGFWETLPTFLRDLVRDPSANRGRRFGQALVMAAELPPGPVWIHAHFAHTPASVARYAAMMRGLPFTMSAHAKDIWTTPDWDLQEKLASADWTVTCTAVGHDRLAKLAPEASVHLVYHGLDLSRFGVPSDARPARDGLDPLNPVRLLSVGRAVRKKGLDILIEALARLPGDLNWNLVHIGSGPELEKLQAKAARLGLADRVSHWGARAQHEVLDAYRKADVFVLASRQTGDGDRDGLPNVIVEAASQALPAVASDISGIPEFIDDGQTGLLVPPEDPAALAEALSRMIADPSLRKRLGQAASERVVRDFDHSPGIARLTALFRTSWSR